MDYTFKNAVEELSELSRKGADIWHGEQLEEKTTVKGLVEVGQAEIIIQKLLKEYAPTVEMTEGQKNTLLEYKSRESLSYTLSERGTTFGAWFWSPLTERQVAQAWLHPESIKVVEE